MMNLYNKSGKPIYYINNLSCKVSLNIIALSNKVERGLNIVDRGADTHVLGNHSIQ